MLGRFQPWHDGHTALFKRAVEKTGQVVIMIRDTNEFLNSLEVERRIWQALSDAGYTHNVEYRTLIVPNIVNITYGRDVGYAIEQESFDVDVEQISASKIRENMTANSV